MHKLLRGEKTANAAWSRNRRMLAKSKEKGLTVCVGLRRQPPEGYHMGICWIWWPAKAPDGLGTTSRWITQERSTQGESNLMNKTIFSGPKHPKPRVSQPDPALQHFTLPHSAHNSFLLPLCSGQTKVLVTASQTCPISCCLDSADRSHLSENHVLFDWLVKYIPMSTAVSTEKSDKAAWVGTHLSCEIHFETQDSEKIAQH